MRDSEKRASAPIFTEAEQQNPESKLQARSKEPFFEANANTQAPDFEQQAFPLSLLAKAKNNTENNPKRNHKALLF
jgi:hypothetical protein